MADQTPAPRGRAPVARHRFDDFTRALATTTSRRDVLRLLGGTLVAGALPG